MYTSKSLCWRGLLKDVNNICFFHSLGKYSNKDSLSSSPLTPRGCSVGLRPQFTSEGWRFETALPRWGTWNLSGSPWGVSGLFLPKGQGHPPLYKKKKFLTITLQSKTGLACCTDGSGASQLRGCVGFYQSVKRKNHNCKLVIGARNFFQWGGCFCGH